jgi:hypothetical protein
MPRIESMPNPISSFPDDSALPVLTGRVKDFITARLARRESPERIAAALRALFAIEINPLQVVPYWRGEIPRPIETEHRPDKESVQIPADAENEPLLTRIPDGETLPRATLDITPEVTPQVTSESPHPEATQTPVANALDSHEISIDADEEIEPATQTGHRQNEDSLCIPADMVDEPSAADLLNRDALSALADLARARLGIAPDPAAATQTGSGPDRKTPTLLTDEIKAFIVRGLARYETPTRIATSVKANFGIEIDRRQVFAYDPAGSRPPAQRWIDLHAATRAKFLQAKAEIGITQKLVRLRMLDRFANRADENNQIARAAALLDQAAKECGGFYERYQRPKGAAAPSN